MDSLDIPHSWSIISVSFVRQFGPREINYKLSQVSPLNQISYLFLQLKTLFRIVPMIPVKLTILSYSYGDDWS